MLRDVFSIFGMNGDLPSLDLAVVTHGTEGIERVARMVLPPIDGVNYVVSWQNHQDAPVPASLAIRKDVEIHRFEKKGQSNNRNNAISHCRADIILHSDDDVTYFKNALNDLRRTFKEKTCLDVATFRSEHGGMTRFPQQEVKLTNKLPKGYWVACFEIAFRRETCKDLRCCPEFGLASEILHGGEDEMFLLSAIKRGLDCRFFPITICAHPHESTGTKARMTPGNLMASGCVIALSYPWSAWLRVPLKAWRIWRKGQAGFAAAFGNIIRGAMMARGVKRRNRDSLW